MSGIICPPFREVVTETPYYVGQGAGYLQNGFIQAVDLYKEFSKLFWDSYPGRVCAHVTNAVIEIQDQITRLQLMNWVGTRLNRLAFVGAIIGGGYALFEGVYDSFNFMPPVVNRVIQQIGHLARRNAVLGMSFLNGAIEIIYYPTELMYKAGFSAAKALYYGVQSKAFIVPTATYFVSRTTYKIACQDYEKKIHQNKNAISLNPWEHFLEGYESVQKAASQEEGSLKREPITN